MKIKSEMLKFGAATATELNNPEQLPVFFFSLFSFHFRLYVQRQQIIACLERFSRTEKENTHTQTHNFMKSCDGITTKNKSTKWEGKNNKPRTMKCTQTQNCLQPFENHILPKWMWMCVCLHFCVLHTSERITFFSCYCLFAFESNILKFSRKTIHRNLKMVSVYRPDIMRSMRWKHDSHKRLNQDLTWISVMWLTVARHVQLLCYSLFIFLGSALETNVLLVVRRTHFSSPVLEF